MSNIEAPPRYGDIMGTMKRAANDWYMEQPDAVEALLRAERFSGLSWDPACGVGTIPGVLEAAGLDVIGSDLVDRADLLWPLHDFLKDEFAGADPIANIVSNPPFNLSRQFADKALSIATHKVAFLLPLTFLEGQERCVWLETTPLARVHVFAYRVSMPPGELLTAGKVKPEGGKKAFAWFVWEQGWRGPAQVRFLHKTEAQ